MLPFIIAGQIGSIKTSVIVFLGGIYAFTMIYQYIARKSEEDNILNHAYQMLSESNEKKLYIDSIATEVGLNRDKVSDIVKIFKRQQKIPYDIELIQQNEAIENEISENNENDTVENEMLEDDETYTRLSDPIANFERRHNIR